jgi:hypothetical protein
MTPYERSLICSETRPATHACPLTHLIYVRGRRYPSTDQMPTHHHASDLLHRLQAPPAASSG